MRYLLLGALLAGCGPDVWYVECMRIEYPQDLLMDGAKFDNRAMHDSAVLARELIDRRYGEGTFCARASEVTVKLEPHWWPCIGSDVGCSGEYIALEARVKVITGVELVHEFIHVQELSECRLGTMWHEGWKVNGQDALSLEYEAKTEAWWQWR